jgi:hypothetical protein
MNDRINNDWEITGNTINLYMGFEEYLCIYFIKVKLKFFIEILIKNLKF